MKKNLFIYAALCALVVTGCSKQDEAEILQPGQGEALDITISATRHEAPSTRTEYEDAADRLIVKWNSDKKDQLGVFTDNAKDLTKNALFTVDGALSADGKTAHFKGNFNVSFSGQTTTVYGYYPYSSTDGGTKEAIIIDLSGQQQEGISGEGSLAHLAAKDYMAATPVTKKFSSGNQNLSLEFHPLLTIMSFMITKAMNVKSIKLEAAGTTNLTPFYTRRAVDITSTAFIITPGGTAQSSVELGVTNGTIAASTTGMFNMMIFPIIAEVMPTHFKVTVTTTTGETYVQIKEVPKETGFERGKRYIMALDALESTKWDGKTATAKADATYSGGDGTQANPYLIASAKDFSQFAANGKDYSAGKHFRLESDIDLYGGGTYGDFWIPIASFSGYFDGGQHTVSNMYVSSSASETGSFGLFATLSGTVTIANLHVQAAKLTAVGTFGEQYVGGICGSILSGSTITLSGCSFAGPVNGNTAAGGICGRSEGTVYITACRNSGTITSESNSGYAGGIIGYVNQDAGTNMITACYNTGKVSSKKADGAGGIVGYAYMNTTVAYACYNTYVGSTLNNIGCPAPYCYAVAANADGNEATLFSSTAWPSANEDPTWKTSPDADGSENKNWKSLGGWNSGTPEYPKLWWEK